MYTKVHCDPGRVTLCELVEGILGDEDGGTGQRDVSVYEDKRTLASLGVTRRKFVTLVDEEGGWGTVGVAVCDLP